MTTTNDTAATGERGKALAILFIMPLFFSSNIIFGRAAVDEVEPFTLAFLRWGFTALLLVPFALPLLKGRSGHLRSITPTLLLMGFMGMWVCGALVYLALKYTTATNGTLIYTSSPVLIILIEWLFKGRAIRWREGFGVTIAFLGIVAIVVRGSWDNLLALQFNLGDLIFVGTALSWAIYSVGLKSNRLQSLGTLPLFMAIAASGAVLLAPFAAAEIVYTKSFPTTGSAWFNITGIVFLASLLAFSAFQYSVKVLGASLAGVFLYLLPVYGVGLAIVFLGEELFAFHIWGIALVLGGVVLATVPTGLVKKR
ncbi:MAG: DMT family transporter [Pseudomonadota bacterium]